MYNRFAYINFVQGITDRKLKHIEIVRDENVEPVPSSFDKYKLSYKAFPELDLADINTQTEFFGKKINLPLIVSSMSGGEAYGRIINENVAIACNNKQIPFGLGSTRIILEKPESKHSFDVKHLCPNTQMFINIGLVQLNYGVGYDEIMHLVNELKADGVFFHANPLQEAVQPEGDTNFKNLYEKFKILLEKLNIPVVAKEVGHGLGRSTMEKLKEIGVEYVDVAGIGGTSWAWVEGYRREHMEGSGNSSENLGKIFAAEGIPTDECLKQAAGLDLKVIAGGGIRNGLHIAKAIALGADFATAAKPFLLPALESSEKVEAQIDKFMHELKIAMFISGAQNIQELKNTQLVTY